MAAFYASFFEMKFHLNANESKITMYQQAIDFNLLITQCNLLNKDQF